MNLASIFSRLAFAIGFFGMWFVIGFLTEAHWTSVLTQIVGFAAGLFFCWGMLRIFLAMERKRAIAQVLRSFDMDDRLICDEERIASEQSDRDCSTIQAGAPPPDSPIKARR